MLIYTIRRFGLAVLVAIAVSMVSFMLIRMSGDPAIALAGEAASAAEIEYVRKQYGFDRPLIIQYLDWGFRVLQGDFGESPYFNQPVTTVIGDRIRVTMTLGLCALTFAVFLSIPMGVLAATRPNTWIDRLALSLSVMGQAMPSFWFGLIMIIIFGVMLRWLPISGSDSPRHFVMPIIALGYYATPAFMRLTRSGMLEVLGTDYVRSARARGLPARTVLWSHAFPNSLLPLITILGLYLPVLFSGAVFVETVFAWPGMGRTLVDAVSTRDYPLILAGSLLFSALVVLGNLAADVLYAVADPRVRHE